MAVHIHSSNLRKQKHEDFYKFKVSLLYTQLAWVLPRIHKEKLNDKQSENHGGSLLLKRQSLAFQETTVHGNLLHPREKDPYGKFVSEEVATDTWFWKIFMQKSDYKFGNVKYKKQH